MEENPAHRWPTTLERHFVEAPGLLQWARPTGASPAFRASEYRLAVYPALDIPVGVQTATCPQSIPQNSLSPPVLAVHQLPQRFWSESDRDSPKPVPW